MAMYEPGKEYYEAFSLMQKDLGAVRKTKKGHNWNYAGLEDIQETIAPVLDKHGFIIQSFRKFVGDIYTLCLSTSLIHKDSEQGVEDLSPMMAYKSSNYDDQESGENATYQRRYALIILLNLKLEEDNVEKRPRKAAQNGPVISGETASKLKSHLASLPNGKALEENIKGHNQVSDLNQLTEDQLEGVKIYLKKSSESR